MSDTVTSAEIVLRQKQLFLGKLASGEYTFDQPWRNKTSGSGMILNHYSRNTNHRKMCHGPTQFNGHLALCFPDELLCKRSRGVLLNQKTTALPCNPTGACQRQLCTHRVNHSIAAKLQLTWPRSQVSPSAQLQVTSQALQWGSSRNQIVHSSSSPPGLPLCPGKGTARCLWLTWWTWAL